MSDSIYIEGLAAYCVIGIFDWEREIKQKILVDISIQSEISLAAVSDEIKDTVDYKAVTKQVISYIESSSHNLIETLAQKIADIVLTHKHVDAVKVKLSKPGAVRFTDNVAVEIVRLSPFYYYYLSLGSNISADENIEKALAVLDKEFFLEKISSVYKSAAWGVKYKQDDFLNMVVLVKSSLALSDMQAKISNIESSLGRIRTDDKFAPRAIDIDIMLHKRLSSAYEGDSSLILAHKYCYLPLLEIAPDIFLSDKNSLLKDTKPEYIDPDLLCEKVS